MNYYEENWELLKKALETEESKKEIHPLNRKQIFEDALAFGWSRDLDYKFVFSLCACLRDEADYLPLSGAYSSLRRIDLILRRTPNYGYFKVDSLKIISEAMDSIEKWKRETINTNSIDKLLKNRYRFDPHESIEKIRT